MLENLEALSLFRMPEVLPRYFIFIVKYSGHIVDRQFLQSACHSKLKGMWLVDEGSKRDRQAWDFMVVR